MKACPAPGEAARGERRRNGPRRGPNRLQHWPRGARLRIAVALAMGLAGNARGEATDGGDHFLETITVVATGVSNMSAASEGDVGQERLASLPLLRPAALLESVPGLIVTQHSGEGKANQYFLRAFNLDHGTDLASEVDDMPVNMPTHAHGQGYSDLNFLIPELVSDLHFKKGPYYADEGDFATAGAVRMGLRNEIGTAANLGFGADGYRRALLTGSASLAAGTVLAAGEAYRNDGPFDLPDDYHRINALLRYRQGTDLDYWTLTGMAYSGKWNSTDQVPQHAVDQGLIGRFGTLNSSDGGDSSRSSLSFNRVLRTDSDQSQISAYVIRYRLDLWSTFTYYLRDPVHGDQMLQHDDRVVYGLKASRTWYGRPAGIPVSTVVGVQARVDDIRDVGILPTVRRQILGTRQNAAVVESSAAVYAESSAAWRDWLRTAIGLREDRFDFKVTDKLLNADGSCNLSSDPLGCNTGTRHAAIFSPKLGVVLGPWARTTYFVNVADGYHSNDARGVTRSGQNPVNPPVTPLTRATSAELGLAATPLPNWSTTLDAFELKLRSELVFSGDAGGTSPSGSTTRKGFEWSNAYRFSRWLAGDLNAAVSRGRFDHNVPADDLGCSDAAPSHPCAQAIAITGRRIPNSPTNVIDAGLTALQGDFGWFGTVRARHFGQSPLVADNSARSPAYTTFDLQIGYRHAQDWTVALDLFNALGSKWNDIEYYYVSRLQNQASPTADYVVHPGVPRTVRLRFQYAL